jgi:hypothetical protein
MPLVYRDDELTQPGLIEPAALDESQLTASGEGPREEWKGDRPVEPVHAVAADDQTVRRVQRRILDASVDPPQVGGITPRHGPTLVEHGRRGVDRIDAIDARSKRAGQIPDPAARVKHLPVVQIKQRDQNIKHVWRVRRAQVISLCNGVEAEPRTV